MNDTYILIIFIIKLIFLDIFTVKICGKNTEKIHLIFELQNKLFLYISIFQYNSILILIHHRYIQPRGFNGCD